MRPTTSSVRLGLLLLLLPSATHAQVAARAQRSSSPVHATVAISGGPGTDLLGLGARVSLRTGNRSTFEVGADWTDAHHDQRWADQIMWFYFWQMKHPVWADRRTSVFATYGTSGWIERQSVPPGRLRAATVPPFLPLVGTSVEQAVARRASVRFDVQVLIWPFEGGTVFPRVSGGVAVPIGR